MSLLPSATEIVFALGLGDSLCGVSFECDYPAEARSKPVVSGTALPTSELATPQEIDAAVSENMAAQVPIYTLEAELIGTIQPDLILAQDLCRVCAVPSGAVDDALAVLGCKAEVLSLDPSNLDEVIGCIGQVGDATGTSERASELMAALRARVERVRQLVSGAPRPRTFALEWADPPFNGGHWVPDMIDAAGGEPVLASVGERSRRVEWDEIAAASPELVVFMPCGYGLTDAVEQGRGLLEVPALAGASIVATDANALFSRPGPRVVDGVEALAWVLHPDRVPAPPAGLVSRLR